MTFTDQSIREAISEVRNAMGREPHWIRINPQDLCAVMCLIRETNKYMPPQYNDTIYGLIPMADETVPSGTLAFKFLPILGIDQYGVIYIDRKPAGRIDDFNPDLLCDEKNQITINYYKKNIYVSGDYKVPGLYE